jgi:E3 ubiquitin-protein ligase RNF5
MSSMPGSLNQEGKTPSLENQLPSTTESSSNNKNSPTFHEGVFECNICLEMASEPVVTLCGHLFW